MVGGLVIGFVVGLILGVILTLAAVRSRLGPATPAATPATPATPPSAAETAQPERTAGPSLAPEPDLEEPIPGPDDDVRQALDATAGLLDELETRYRDRPAPRGDDDAPGSGAPARRSRRRR